MAVASLLTLLALAGVAIGLAAGQSRTLSSHVAAAGGGLLFGIAIFWLLPEIAESLGWIRAVSLAAVALCGLVLIDRVLLHRHDSPGHGVIGPLLAATAAHSFLDGWSVRVFSGQPLANIAVPLGLGLHKIPEGVAVGWIARRSFPSTWKAACAGVAVEAMTLVGAWAEPRVDASGAARFGAWWTATVLAIIAGSFLFLGVHAVLPARRRVGVIAVFVGTVVAVAIMRGRLGGM